MSTNDSSQDQRKEILFYLEIINITSLFLKMFGELEKKYNLKINEIQKKYQDPKGIIGLLNAMSSEAFGDFFKMAALFAGLKGEEISADEKIRLSEKIIPKLKEFVNKHPDWKFEIKE